MAKFRQNSALPQKYIISDQLLITFAFGIEFLVLRSDLARALCLKFTFMACGLGRVSA